MIIRPTPVSIIKLKGPLPLIFSLITTIFLTIRNGIFTLFLWPVISKYCAFAEKKEQFKRTTHSTHRNIVLKNITEIFYKLRVKSQESRARGTKNKRPKQGGFPSSV